MTMTTERPGRRGWLSILAGLLVLPAAAARADVDAPGTLLCDFWADEQRQYQAIDEVPTDAVFLGAQGQEVYFSSAASHFGPGGVLIWAGFPVDGDPLGPRYGILTLDLDLARAPADDQTPMPRSAVRAEYLEKRGDELVFAGTPVEGDVWIVDIVFSESDEGALEGDFAFLFTDPQAGGSRVLLRGLFLSEPSPADLRQSFGRRYQESDEYVAVDCSGDVYAADEDPGCGGEDPDSSGCEGDTGGDASGGCEGDSGGCEGDSGGCEGDAGGSTSCSGCEGDAHAALRPPRRSGGPLRALLRFVPELTGLLFIAWLRRRIRRKW